MMKSNYIVFPIKEEVALAAEEISPPDDDQVLCATQCSLLSSGTESACLRGVFDAGTNWEAWTQYPFRPGYSAAARVIAVGQNVDGVRAGDRVVAAVPHQQFFKCRPGELFPIPNMVSDEAAAWTLLAMTAQLGVRRAQLALGERVGVVGMGPLGQLVVQYLALAGCRERIAIDRNPLRGKMARAHGATNVISADVNKARMGVELLTGGEMLDVVFDVTGNPQALAPATELLRRFGRLVLLGDTPTPSQQYLGPNVVGNSLAILGIHASARPMQGSDFFRWGVREMVTLFFEEVAKGQLRVADLITHRFSPLAAPQVYEMLRRDRSTVMGVVFDWRLLTSAD